MYSIDLQGKNALVMGVANHRSIAWAAAKTLREAGARLAFTYPTGRIREELERLTRDDPQALLLPCDVTREDDIRVAFDALAVEAGALHVLMHSIAFARPEDLVGDFSRTPREGFQAALDVSAYSLLAAARYAKPLMEKEGGSIVTVTFLASERVFPGYNVMGTAKAALENIVRQLAAELGPRGIRVNALSPAPMDTLSARSIRGFSEMKKAYAQWSPLCRNVTQEEVGKAALFLASGLSSAVTGAVIPVDAGFHIMEAARPSPG